MSDDGREPAERPGDSTRARDGDGSQRAAWQLFAYDVATALAGVALVGGLLLAVSGVWPPLVAIESPSMEPNIDTGDLVFVMDEDRFPGPRAVGDTGVVTAERGDDVGYTKFQRPGDVIVFEPGGDADTTPIIHRAMFWVEENESWYDEANPDYVGSYDGCQEMPHCPARTAGFITKGDGNSNYDQINAGEGSRPVKPEWVIGTAEARIPGLGRLRLGLEGLTTPAPVEANGSASVAAGG